MKKQILETFIKKYSLNGTIESAKWIIESKPKVLKTSSRTDDAKVSVDVQYSDFSELSDSEFGIFDTSKLTKMLGVLSSDITMEFIQKNNKISALSIKDAESEVKYTTADLSVVNTFAPFKITPTFEVELELNGDFISKFIKAKNALPDVTTFTIAPHKKKKIQFIVGGDNENSNKIILDVKAKDGLDELENPITFNAKHLKEILNGNSECDETVLRIDTRGLAKIEFEKDNFKSTYYLTNVDSDN